MPLADETFSAELRAQLARKQLTSRGLAVELGISPSQAGRLLKGQSPWSLKKATQAASWSGLDFVSIFSSEELGL